MECGNGRQANLNPLLPGICPSTRHISIRHCHPTDHMLKRLVEVGGFSYQLSKKGGIHDIASYGYDNSGGGRPAGSTCVRCGSDSRLWVFQDPRRAHFPEETA